MLFEICRIYDCVSIDADIKNGQCCNWVKCIFESNMTFAVMLVKISVIVLFEYRN
jgi:hypothetical protein